MVTSYKTKWEKYLKKKQQRNSTTPIFLRAIQHAKNDWEYAHNETGGGGHFCFKWVQRFIHHGGFENEMLRA